MWIKLTESNDSEFLREDIRVASLEPGYWYDVRSSDGIVYVNGERANCLFNSREYMSKSPPECKHVWCYLSATGDDEACRYCGKTKPKPGVSHKTIGQVKDSESNRASGSLAKECADIVKKWFRERE